MIPSGGLIICGIPEGIPLILAVGAPAVVGSMAMLVGTTKAVAESVPVGTMVCGGRVNLGSSPAEVAGVAT